MLILLGNLSQSFLFCVRLDAWDSLCVFVFALAKTREQKKLFLSLLNYVSVWEFCLASATTHKKWIQDIISHYWIIIDNWLSNTKWMRQKCKLKPNSYICNLVFVARIFGSRILDPWWICSVVDFCPHKLMIEIDILARYLFIFSVYQWLPWNLNGENHGIMVNV